MEVVQNRLWAQIQHFFLVPYLYKCIYKVISENWHVQPGLVYLFILKEE